MIRGIGLACVALFSLAACGAKGVEASGFDDAKDASAGNAPGDSSVPSSPGTDAETDTGPVLGGDEAGGGGSVDGCVKVSNTETKCDGIDDDCNGKVDDVDVGKDGICDCIRIGLIGKKGWYGSNNFEAWLTSKGTTVARIQEATTDTLTDTQLAPFDMVILDWLQRDYSFAEAQTFQTWLNAHHGVLALSGYAPDYQQSRPNSLIGTIGLQLWRR